MSDPTLVTQIITTGTASVSVIGADGSGKSKVLTAAEVRAAAETISETAINTALSGKQATLVSGTNIKTVGGSSILGSGDLAVSGFLVNYREYFPTIANGTDADHDLNIGAARIWVSNGTDERPIDFAARVKQIDAAWAAGTNQGGLDTGTVGNATWYYLWAIYNPTTLVADYLYSASATSPTMPSGYTFKRRVRGAVLTNSSANVRAFRQIENAFYFLTTITDLNTTSPSLTTYTSWTPSVPPLSGVFWFGALLFDRSVSTAVTVNLTYSTSSITHPVGIESSRLYIPLQSSTASGTLYYSVDDNTSFSAFQFRTSGFIDNGVV